MSINLNKRRRQVAWFCFEPLLTETQLIEAIRLLERDYQTDSVSNLVAYITKVCTVFHIETTKSMHLYSQFRELMTTGVDTQPDPLSRITSGDAATVAISRPSSSKIDTKTAPAHEFNATLSPRCIIFRYFLQHILANLPEKSALLISLKEFQTDPKQHRNPLTILVGRWLINPTDYAWTNTLDTESMASLVHLVYTNLCELFGPIEADEYFHKAIASTEQQPEAKQFSPTRFL